MRTGENVRLYSKCNETLKPLFELVVYDGIDFLSVSDTFWTSPSKNIHYFYVETSFDVRVHSPNFSIHSTWWCLSTQEGVIWKNSVLKSRTQLIPGQTPLHRTSRGSYDRSHRLWHRHPRKSSPHHSLAKSTRSQSKFLSQNQKNIVKCIWARFESRFEVCSSWISSKHSILLANVE